jgi:dihydroxy-acid dehydratase
MTVTGKTLGGEREGRAAAKRAARSFSRSRSPCFPRGHLRILRGNLAPDGAVAKITGKEGERFSGPAKVFDSKRTCCTGLEKGEIAKGSVVVIRYEGPKVGPACRRC